MKQYLELLDDILLNGADKEDRTGVGTISVFGRQLRFNLQDGFPLVTTKKIHWKSVREELLWMLRGETNIRSLQDAGVTIWDEWADERGELGPVYGVQWRHWDSRHQYNLDQIKNVIDQIKKNPDSRRLIVTAWNPGEIDKMALPPCHMMFQFNVTNGFLSCHMYQRSADCFLGLPFNIASYALLTHMVAHVTGLQVGDLIITLGDAHIYKNHIKQVEEQLKRDPLPLPELRLNSMIRDIDDFTSADIHLNDYDFHPAIKAAVAV